MRIRSINGLLLAMALAFVGCGDDGAGTPDGGPDGGSPDAGDSAMGCTDDPVCDGASDGDSFCTDNAAVTCAIDADGCLAATSIDCGAGETCDDASATAECSGSSTCEDHPLCAVEDLLSCNDYFLNTCSAGADGCLDLTQDHCGAALCDSSASPTACGSRSETGLACASAIPAASGFRLSGSDFVTDFAGGINLTSTDVCQPTGDPGTTGVVLQLDLVTGDTALIVQAAAMNSVVSVMASTCDAASACTASEDSFADVLEYTATADGPVFAIIENFDLEPSRTNYDIQVYINAACGNGVVEPRESCDDGNVVDGDGCDSACAPQFGYSCDAFSPSTCSPVEDLGSFGAGDAIPTIMRAAAGPDDLHDFFLITFTETVVFSGSLVATGGVGDYEFFLLDEDRDFIQSDELGDEAWSGHFIPAGVYMAEVELFEYEEGVEGYTLEMSTGAPEAVAVGDTVTESGGVIEEDASHYVTYTFSDDVFISGTLVGTEDSDLDLYISGADGVATASFADGDEAFGIALLAGTYSFRISALWDTETFALDFTTTALAVTDLGSYGAGESGAFPAGAITDGAFDHYTITFTEDVLLTGLLNGNTTGETNMAIYDADSAEVTSADFTDEAVPAGRYIVQIRTTPGAGDVDAYRVALSTSAP